MPDVFSKVIDLLGPEVSWLLIYLPNISFYCGKGVYNSPHSRERWKNTSSRGILSQDCLIINQILYLPHHSSDKYKTRFFINWNWRGMSSNFSSYFCATIHTCYVALSKWTMDIIPRKNNETCKCSEKAKIFKKGGNATIICICKSPQWTGPNDVCFNTSALPVVPNQFKFHSMERQFHCLHVLLCLEHGVTIVLNKAL